MLQLSNNKKKRIIAANSSLFKNKMGYFHNAQSLCFKN